MAKTREKTNNQLLLQISSELSSVSREVSRLREALKDAHKDIIKLNLIEEKIKKGEEVAKDTSGWFWWTKEMPT
tara:strand:+ start:303 stop:524 length:222 start_codon:yes stop_codon:yes gene_type:complete